MSDPSAIAELPETEAAIFRLNRLDLTDFRNYGRLSWSPAARIAVISGPNGSGKTNLLEAISLLGPGRGLRQARVADFARLRADDATSWAVAARVRAPDAVEPLIIGTGSAPDGGERRIIRLDGATVSQTELASHIAISWITPQMDRLFGEGPGGRRRFLDRLVWALDPAHARDVAAHDAAMTRRNRLLAEGRADPAWLAGLEDGMARHAVASTAGRRALVNQLNATLARGAVAPFPAARLALLCPIADRLAEAPALAVEDWLRAALAASRTADAASGSASLGAHRTDLGLSDLQSGRPAALASTGQQKALLLGVVLGHALVIAEARGFAPWLLLDEPLVHLDDTHRAALLEALGRLPAQAFLTGTDAAPFAALQGHAEFCLCMAGGLVENPGFARPQAKESL
ncbi:DNA replication/repair protein RecF [Acidisoma cladoniae]|uniref:DNA replication/repair protein RecF n=1 Tax=Acidisoma cladoniae TaxID=3040935 RepID=UPI00254D9BDF|nr:DNA replication/repair protein RecF [Acidisoma sp. PAMC 29798]